MVTTVQHLGLTKYGNIDNYIKSKVVLVFNQVQQHEDVWGSGGIAPSILNLGNGWTQAVSFTHRSLYPRRRAPDTHWIGGWVSSRAGLDVVEK
jgi:hypothetical protein